MHLCPSQHHTGLPDSPVPHTERAAELVGDAVLLCCDTAALHHLRPFLLSTRLASVLERLRSDPFNNFWTKIAEFAQRIFVVPTPPPGSLKLVSACRLW